MFSSKFKTELTWLISGLAGAVMIGIIIGWPATVIALFLAGYAVWLLYRMENVVKWLRAGAKKSKAPFSHGLSDEMIELVHREKKYSRKQNNRFKHSLAQFNALAANLPDAIIVIDKHHNIRWSNPAALTLLNIHPENDLGQRVDSLIRNPVFGEYLEGNNEHTEVEIPSPTMAEKTLALRKVPNANKLIVLIAADITQRVRVREMRKAFVGDVSHELRTPLTVISGYLEMLQEQPNLDKKTADALQEVSQQSDRMRSLVEDLLELSKLEANPLGENEGELVNVPAMVHAMMQPIKKTAPTHIFESHIDDSLGLVGNERELYSACNNLLTNAVKYTTPKTTITVSWTLDTDGFACFRVADNGPGIETRHLSRLSERFYRVDEGRSREQGGTGLGLAIVKHAVQRHGGKLEIDSVPGIGSTFSATFPSERIERLAQAVTK